MEIVGEKREKKRIGEQERNERGRKRTQEVWDPKGLIYSTTSL